MNDPTRLGTILAASGREPMPLPIAHRNELRYRLNRVLWTVCRLADEADALEAAGFDVKGIGARMAEIATAVQRSRDTPRFGRLAMSVTVQLLDRTPRRSHIGPVGHSRPTGADKRLQARPRPL